MTSNCTFGPGDTFAYRSVTQRHWVTWTRNAEGEWWADDGRECAASDADVATHLEAEDCVFTPAGRKGGS